VNECKPLSIDEDDEEQIHLGDELSSAALGYSKKELLQESIWEVQKEFTMSYNQAGAYTRPLLTST